ncbi:carotenoid oxygenase family protein [Kibdelosporangium phytohabitans]|uniref:Dioxygenase n=1 Tax=Kibdelosporangium phytohabitans TaxID=860235 RepID=A0A0N9IC58_9PSEU|nr:carotenoid oxygenase family protein [Kibdelosporangium phytohabitans]ALG13874.1 carotenoid oxygenase [Kibdelosporangium phytohabitans]MBE1467191.1 carotenoid cleavage dioxygenase [Kibdelosporangium phytohabitans]
MDNHYLTGNLGPTRHEHTATDLRVSGKIPDFLDGRYVRNGPNPAADLDPELYHWFMGDGMLHGVRLRDGRAEWYRNRWVRTPRLRSVLGEPAARKRGRRAVAEFLGANTSVIGHAGRTLALVEGGPSVVELTDELDTVGPCDFDGTLPGGYTAHPIRDPETGDLHAVSYSIGRGNTVQYSVIGADGRAKRTVDIEVTGSPMMHAFSLTRNHVVLYDLPVVFDAAEAVEIAVPRPLRLPVRLVLSAIVGRVRVPHPILTRLDRTLRPNARMPYRWDPEYPARIGVMPRDGDQVRWLEVDACYVYHPVNAYEDGDTIVLDIVRMPKTMDVNRNGPIEHGGEPELHRWTVDLAAGKVREECLDDRSQEFPRVDERLAGRRHRYGYLVGGTTPDRPIEALIKHDFAGNGSVTREFGPGHGLGEFCFIPAHDTAAEDDGVLVGYVHVQAEDRSDLAILDAGTLETVASVHLPYRVPMGFHGNWLPSHQS